jgi:hypothetical protein
MLLIKFKIIPLVGRFLPFPKEGKENQKKDTG